MTTRAPLFFTGLTIKNFRGYGDFPLEVPATPCVVLLSGPNGLGKTSLFEAMEWGLTGSVKRLDFVSDGRVDPRNLARRAAGVEALEVHLSFRDAQGHEERVRRTQLIPFDSTPSPWLGTSVTGVADLLRSADSRWNVTGTNVADYLHLTHLHAQVASLRLVTFSAKERWLRVSPLAGADRFERVRTNLTNSKAALTKLRDGRADELAQATKNRELWLALLERLAELQSLSTTVTDVFSPPEILERIAAFRSELGFESDTAVLSNERDVAGASEAIRLLRVALEAARDADQHQLTQLARLRVALRQWTSAQTRNAALATQRDALLRDEVRLRTRAQELSRITNDLALEHDAAKDRRHQDAEFHERLTRGLRDREELVVLQKALTEADANLRAAAIGLEEAEVELRRREEALGAHAAWLEARERVRQDINAFERALSALGEIETLTKGLEAEERRHNALAKRSTDLDLSMSALVDELQAQDAAISVAKQDLDTRRSAFAAFQAALVTIVEHLGSEDATCPICRTEFAPGLLRERAHQALAEMDPRLAAADTLLAARQEDRIGLVERQAVLALDRRKAEADLRASSDALTQLTSRLKDLRRNPMFADLGVDQARVQLNRNHAAKNAELQAIDITLAGAGETALLQRAVLEGRADVDSERRRRAVADERRNSRLARIEELRVRSEQLARQYPDLDATDEVLRAAIQAAAIRAANAKEAVDASAAKLAETETAALAVRRDLAASEETRTQVHAELTANEAASHDFQRQWSSAGLADPPTERILDRDAERLGQRRVEFDERLTAVAALSHSLERWRDAAALQSFETEVREQHGPLTREEHTRRLDDAVKGANVALDHAQRARDAADQLSDTLGRVSSVFGDRALRPFDSLFKRYLRALVHDERFHTIEAAYEPAARSASLRFRVSLGGSDTDAEYILSEGQLGEVSLAAMLAASTAFPWSRWRALLLDDPTQYNDLIHVTALFDVVRNLVLFARYQVLVSTHDHEQAAFLRRKLDGVGIPWVDCRYIGHAADGILVDVRSSATTPPRLSA